MEGLDNPWLHLALAKRREDPFAWRLELLGDLLASADAESAAGPSIVAFREMRLAKLLAKWSS